MLNKEEAQAIALAAIADLTSKWDGIYLILEESIIEKDFAWAFPFNTKEYAETKDIMDMAIGLGPVVVNRQNGAVVVAPPMPIEQFLAQYRAELSNSK